MTEDLLYLAVLTASGIMLINAFSTKIKNMKAKVVLLMLGDSGLLGSYLFYAYGRMPHTVVELLIFAIINALILWKIFSNENAEEETLLIWRDVPSNWQDGVFYDTRGYKHISLLKRITTFVRAINFANPISVLAMIGVIVLILTAALFMK